MTIIAIHDGVLGADSANVYANGTWNESIQTNAKKIYVSECKRLAIASTGYATPDRDLAAVAAYFTDRITAYFATGDAASLRITKTDAASMPLADAVYYVLTTKGFLTFSNVSIGSMNFHELSETLAYGLPTAHFYTAINLGLPFVEALEHACKMCCKTRPPIHTFSAKELLDFEVCNAPS